MTLQIIDTANDPGTPGKSGDDRYGFDAGAGRAWVIDGATDATDLKPFPGAESGAAWLAETVSRRLMSGPLEGETIPGYFGRVLTDAAAEARRQSKVPVESLPGEALPVASMMWMRRRGEACEFVWAGDCFAIARTGNGEVRLIGTEAKASDETRAAAQMLRMPAADRWALLQAQRRAANAPENGLLSLNPASARHFCAATITLPPGAPVLLMTDGFFRLVDPYGLDTPLSLLGRVLEGGLASAIGALRQHEETPRAVRLKARDDAAAVLVRHSA